MIVGNTESSLEGLFRRLVPKDEYICLKFLSNTRGVPDRIVFGKNRCWLVELKTESGRLSRIQEHTHAKLAALGWPVRVLKGSAEIREFIKELKG